MHNGENFVFTEIYGKFLDGFIGDQALSNKVWKQSWLGLQGWQVHGKSSCRH